MTQTLYAYMNKIKIKKNQYPLRLEVKEGLILIIKDLKRQGLLIEATAHIILGSERDLTNGG
jgi:hypothetical protein